MKEKLTLSFVRPIAERGILYTIAWGFIGLLFINHIHPFFSKKIEKSLSAIPTYILKVLIYLMPIILIVDTIFSSLKYLGKL